MAKVEEAEVRITLRLPAYLHAKLADASAKTSRSMNGEIISRLQESFDGPFLDLSSAGLTALIKRLEMTVEASHDLLLRQRDAVRERQSRRSQKKR